MAKYIACILFLLGTGLSDYWQTIEAVQKKIKNQSLIFTQQTISYVEADICLSLICSSNYNAITQTKYSRKLSKMVIFDEVLVNISPDRHMPIAAKRRPSRRDNIH